MRFTARVTIVTGGAGGTGLETAKLLGSEGARVCAADLNQEQAAGKHAMQARPTPGPPRAVACLGGRGD